MQALQKLRKHVCSYRSSPGELVFCLFCSGSIVSKLCSNANHFYALHTSLLLKRTARRVEAQLLIFLYLQFQSNWLYSLCKKAAITSGQQI